MTSCDPIPAPDALTRLRPRRPVDKPPVVRRDDVPSWEWTGLHLDGVLVPLWGDFSRVRDVREDPTIRASSLSVVVPPRGAVGRLAAAWVHAGGDAPRRVDVLVRSGARRPDPHPDRVTAEADLADDDVIELAGVRVTTVTRTALDIARWVQPSVAVPALRTLVPHGLEPRRALRLLEVHAGGRGVRTARRVLQQV